MPVAWFDNGGLKRLIRHGVWGRLMEIVSSKKTEFLIGKIFEKYYEQILEELRKTELEPETIDMVLQEIIAGIYHKVKNGGIDSEEVLEQIASSIVNEEIEKALVSYYTQKYINKFSIDKEPKRNNILISNKEAEEDDDYDYDDYDLEIKEQDKVQVQSTTSVVRKIEEPRIRRFRINWKVTILLSLLISLILWLVVGILMGRGYLPRVDIGYTWFNRHIFSIF